MNNQEMNLDTPFILSYELQDDPGYEHEKPVADLNDARVHLQGKGDMVVWADLHDTHGNIVADTDALL